MYEIIFYETESGKVPYKEYLLGLTKHNKQKELTQITHYMSFLQKYGHNTNNYLSNAVKPIDKVNKIYELRPPNSRVLYFYMKGKKIVILNAHKKTKMKEPRREIKKAKEYKRDYLRRNIYEKWDYIRKIN